MDLLYTRCAGLDVDPRSVSACARIVVDGQVSHEVRTFGCSSRELNEMADWLAAVGCTHVAMESTGVYWKPVWHVLEGRFELVLANALYARNIPGRESDVKDAVWISDLLHTGSCAAASCRPRRPRNCAICRARAGSWCVRSHGTRGASRRPWQTPTSG